MSYKRKKIRDEKSTIDNRLEVQTGDKRKKKAPDENGVMRDAKWWIYRFLEQDGKMPLEGIRNKLKNKNIEYESNKGLTDALNLMIEDGIIKKMEAKPRPYYYAIRAEAVDMGWLSQEFKLGIASKLRDDRYLQAFKRGADTESIVEELLKLYGAYMMYVQIQSWNITDSDKDYTYNYDIRKAWFTHAIRHGKEILMFEDMITTISGLTYYRTTEEYEETLSLICKNEKKWKKFKEVEEIFKRKYGPYCELFDEMFEKAEKDAGETREWVKKMYGKERTKKRRAGKRK